MPNSLEYLRTLCLTTEDAVHWACILEATSPKPGNVFPSRTFNDLSYLDFVAAAQVSANCLSDETRPFAERIYRAVLQTREACGSNVNLGILLLLGPLVVVDQTSSPKQFSDWPTQIKELFDQITPKDSQFIFQAIASASAGGLGKVEQLDVHDSPDDADILHAMSIAQTYDHVALQYATRFDDLVHQVLPVVYDSVVASGDTLTGIVKAHVRLLAMRHDTLISRKNGTSVAEQVHQQAQEVDLADTESIQKFDRQLRTEDHRLNPGTTADLIAASLYLLLRTPPPET